MMLARLVNGTLEQNKIQKMYVKLTNNFTCQFLLFSFKASKDNLNMVYIFKQLFTILNVDISR